MEVALRAVGDVVLAGTRVEHRAEDEDINDEFELAWLVEVIESLGLDELAHDLERDLVAPRVDKRHRDVINEDKHFLAAGRPKGFALALLDRRLDLTLEDGGGGGLRERHLLVCPRGRVSLAKDLENDRGLGGTRTTNEDYRPVLRHREAQVVLAPHRVDGGDEEGGERRCKIFGLACVLPGGDKVAPVRPLLRGVVNLVFEASVGCLALGQVLGEGAQKLVDLCAVGRL
mmetsp:Transcript_36307/g.72219  ORF Transcript_36307/g.72219 Transcript_36307/m.72219 type:complete len:230 (-) Transcript_36307:1296-1985(-)